MFFKNQLPLTVTFFTGLLVMIQYFFNIKAWANLTRVMVNWRVIVAAFALAVGMGNLIVIHGKRIERKHRDAPYSVVGSRLKTVGSVR